MKLKPLQDGVKGKAIDQEVVKLSALQLLVVKHYQGGLYAHMTTRAEAIEENDSQLTLLMDESNWTADKEELLIMLGGISYQLDDLILALEADKEAH